MNHNLNMSFAQLSGHRFMFAHTEFSRKRGRENVFAHRNLWVHKFSKHHEAQSRIFAFGVPRAWTVLQHIMCNWICSSLFYIEHPRFKYSALIVSMKKFKHCDIVNFVLQLFTLWHLRFDDICNERRSERRFFEKKRKNICSFIWF